MLLRDKLSLIQVFRLTWRPDLLIIMVCSLAYVADTYWLKQHISIPVTVSAVLGTALAFFIGFNNNQAYDRWWEGRKIWGAIDGFCFREMNDQVVKNCDSMGKCERCSSGST